MTTAMVSLLEIDRIGARFDEAAKEWDLSEGLIERFYIHLNQTRREPDRVTDVRLTCAEKDDDPKVLAQLRIGRADEDAGTITVPIMRGHISRRIEMGEHDASEVP